VKNSPSIITFFAAMLQLHILAAFFPQSQVIETKEIYVLVSHFPFIVSTFQQETSYFE